MYRNIVSAPIENHDEDGNQDEDHANDEPNDDDKTDQLALENVHEEVENQAENHENEEQNHADKIKHLPLDKESVRIGVDNNKKEEDGTPCEQETSVQDTVTKDTNASQGGNDSVSGTEDTNRNHDEKTKQLALENESVTLEGDPPRVEQGRSRIRTQTKEVMIACQEQGI